MPGTRHAHSDITQPFSDAHQLPPTPLTPEAAKVEVRERRDPFSAQTVNLRFHPVRSSYWRNVLYFLLSNTTLGRRLPQRHHYLHAPNRNRRDTKLMFSLISYTLPNYLRRKLVEADFFNLPWYQACRTTPACCQTCQCRHWRCLTSIHHLSLKSLDREVLPVHSVIEQNTNSSLPSWESWLNSLWDFLWFARSIWIQSTNLDCTNQILWFPCLPLKEDSSWIKSAHKQPYIVHTQQLQIPCHILVSFNAIFRESEFRIYVSYLTSQIFCSYQNYYTHKQKWFGIQ